MTSDAVSSRGTAVDTPDSGTGDTASGTTVSSAGVQDNVGPATTTTITGGGTQADDSAAIGTTIDQWLRDVRRRWSRIRVTHRPRHHGQQRW